MDLDDTLAILIPLGINILNIVLLLVLMHAFWTNYRRLRSSFTRGLLLFVIAFFLQSILSLAYFVLITIHLGLEEGLLHNVLPAMFNLFETAALVILIRVTRE